MRHIGNSSLVSDISDFLVESDNVWLLEEYFLNILYYNVQIYSHVMAVDMTHFEV